ncbi:MAG: ABC transporter ATP-binding protein [Pirellulaceae bacterium]
MSDATPAITLNEVRVDLSGAEILRGVSAHIPTGRLVGLVGPNGAGKSTLLRAVCGQVPLSGGSVAVNGQPLHRLSRRQVARRVCLLPQDANLAIPFTVREVVAMGRNPHLGRFQSFGDKEKEIVQRAMKQASVDALAERRVTELSGGEKQRALLARSLATEAPILLLDEPTASLDILHQLEVLALLQQLTEHGKTIVAALHDLNMARRICSHIMLIHHGCLVAQGSPDETLSRDHVEHVFGVHVSSAHENGLVFQLPQP